jgi:hypothetical protein
MVDLAVVGLLQPQVLEDQEEMEIHHLPLRLKEIMAVREILM